MITAVGILTAVFRFLIMEGIPNDHFLHLAGAQQILFGEWPTKDFADPGLPLMYALSAAAQAVGGHTLFPEALVVSAAFGLGASLTAIAVIQLTNSLSAAMVATLLEVAIVPRTYGYPKILLYSAAFVLFGRYVQRPTAARMAAMAGMAIVAFLFRHDHGLYIGFGGLVTVVFTPGPSGAALVRRAVNYVLMLTAMVLPYLIYVQAFDGLGYYVRTGIAFSAREAQRQGRVWPNPLATDEPALAFALYLFHLIPAVAAAGLIGARRSQVAQIVPIVAVGVLVNFSFMRDPLGTRLPDAVVPAVTLGGWLLYRAWSARRLRVMWIVTSLAVLAGAARVVSAVGNTSDEIGRMGLSGQWSELPSRLSERTAELRERFADRQIPTAAVRALIPFFAYLDRCTTPGDRLFVAGFMPEVHYFARRPFAGGQSTYVSGYYGSTENQRRVIERLAATRVPFVLIARSETPDFDDGFPLVASYLRSRYIPLTIIPVPVNDDEIEISVDRSLAGAVDPQTGWPCRR